MSSKYTAFRCPEDLLEKAKVRAKKDRRSLSNYLIMLIEKDVKEESKQDSDYPLAGTLPQSNWPSNLTATGMADHCAKSTKPPL